jgi:hypothetical protein
MGISPYFALIGTHPLIPLDIIEATYLLPPLTSILSTTDLIARQAIELQKRQEDLVQVTKKVYEAQNRVAQTFERNHKVTIRDFDFKRGALVFIQNMVIEKSLNRKMCARYLEPLIIIVCNRRGAYILSELNDAVLDRLVAAFRVIPYFAQLTIPLSEHFKDVLPQRIQTMVDDNSQGDNKEVAEL